MPRPGFAKIRRQGWAEAHPDAAETNSFHTKARGEGALGRVLPVVFSAVLFLAPIAHAQGPRTDLPEPAPVTVLPAGATTRAPTSAGIIGSGASDYRYTGMYVGLGFFATLSGLGYLMCSGMEEGCGFNGWALAGGVALFGGVGAMIGRAFPKHAGTEQIPGGP